MQKKSTSFNINKNIIGRKFCDGTVISFLGLNKRKNNWEYEFEVKCDCGNIYSATHSELKRCRKKNCGKHRGRPVSYNHRDKNVVFKKIGKLSIIEEPIDDYYVKCLCDCNEYVYIEYSKIISGKTTHCGCMNSKSRGKNNQFYHGYEEVSQTYWKKVQNNASSRNLEFSITIEYIWDLFVKQNKRCALSGLELTIQRSKSNAGNASLDRIDSFKGYTIGNVQWVHKDINKMKTDFSQEEFIELCTMIHNFINDDKDRK